MTTASTKTLEALRGKDKAVLARTLAEIEKGPDRAAALAILDAAYAAPIAQVVGITGPPGVGKSSLLRRLITEWRRAGRSVGVIAVDPSSRRSGGALLGDRLRLAADPEDAGLFIRSMAARERLGGLADLTVAAMVIMRALFDLVIIETVGVGQSETDVASAADSVVFCVQPGSGDSLQFMKAGIVEIPHVAVVTKSDMETPARRALADLKGALSLAGSEDWPVRVLACSAASGEGISTLVAVIDEHWRHLIGNELLTSTRHIQAELWLREALRARFGREGLARAGSLTLREDESPFGKLSELSRRLASS